MSHSTLTRLQRQLDDFDSLMMELAVLVVPPVADAVQLDALAADLAIARGLLIRHVEAAAGKPRKRPVAK